MARDNQVMNILLIAGGGYALYYILNNYGPNGAVATAGGLSYWQTWFGSSALAAASSPSSLPASTTGTPQPVNTPAQTVPVQSPAPVPVGVTVSPLGINIYSAMSNAAASNAFIQQTGGQADAYQWATLWNAQGQPAIDVGSLFTAAQLNPPVLAGPFNPAPAPVSTQGLPLMSLTQFLSTLQSAGIKPAAGSTFGLSGMGAIINLPSFNSGRGGFSGGFRGGFRGKPLVN